MKISEREQLRLFQSGDRPRDEAARGGFDALYAEYGDRVYRFCYRLCGHATDAEDLAQDVFVAAYQGVDRFEGRSSVVTWLYRIALYRWARVRAARRPETVPLDEAMAGAAAVPDPASAGVERLTLDEALLALPEGLRDVFLLVKAEGLKYREAAQVLGLPQGTVQSRVHDAVVRLRGLLAEEGRDPPAARDRQAEAEDLPDQKDQSPRLSRGEPLPP